MECRIGFELAAKGVRQGKFTGSSETDRPLCPIEFQEYDNQLLSNPKKFSEIANYAFSRIGLLVVGETGAGKTRAIWQLLRRIYVDEGKEFKFFTGIRFANEMQASYRMEDRSAWVDGLMDVNVLAIDDIDKMKFTERMETEIFGIIDDRISNRKKTIITTNISGDELIARMPIVGEPLVRRLREFCEVIKF
jgi:DNA replication protein DnaC